MRLWGERVNAAYALSTGAYANVVVWGASAADGKGRRTEIEGCMGAIWRKREIWAGYRHVLRKSRQKVRTARFVVWSETCGTQGAKFAANVKWVIREPRTCLRSIFVDIYFDGKKRSGRGCPRPPVVPPIGVYQ